MSPPSGGLSRTARPERPHHRPETVRDRQAGPHVGLHAVCLSCGDKRWQRRRRRVVVGRGIQSACAILVRVRTRRRNWMPVRARAEDLSARSLAGSPRGVLAAPAATVPSPSSAALSDASESLSVDPPSDDSLSNNKTPAPSENSPSGRSVPSPSSPSDDENEEDDEDAPFCCCWPFSRLQSFRGHTPGT